VYSIDDVIGKRCEKTCRDRQPKSLSGLKTLLGWFGQVVKQILHRRKFPEELFQESSSLKEDCVCWEQAGWNTEQR
jgi:hypothetical protein